MFAHENAGPTSGAAGLLLNASRSLFPLSVGSFGRLLSSMVHSQVGTYLKHARFSKNKYMLRSVLCPQSVCQGPLPLSVAHTLLRLPTSDVCFGFILVFSEKLPWSRVVVLILPCSL